MDDAALQKMGLLIKERICCFKYFCLVLVLISPIRTAKCLNLYPFTLISVSADNTASNTPAPMDVADEDKDKDVKVSYITDIPKIVTL